MADVKFYGTLGGCYEDLGFFSTDKEIRKDGQSTPQNIGRCAGGGLELVFPHEINDAVTLYQIPSLTFGVEEILPGPKQGRFDEARGRQGLEGLPLEGSYTLLVQPFGKSNFGRRFAFGPNIGFGPSFVRAKDSGYDPEVTKIEEATEEDTAISDGEGDVVGQNGVSDEDGDGRVDGHPTDGILIDNQPGVIDPNSPLWKFKAGAAVYFNLRKDPEKNPVWLSADFNFFVDRFGTYTPELRRGERIGYAAPGYGARLALHVPLGGSDKLPEAPEVKKYGYDEKEYLVASEIPSPRLQEKEQYANWLVQVEENRDFNPDNLTYLARLNKIGFPWKEEEIKVETQWLPTFDANDNKKVTGWEYKTVFLVKDPQTEEWLPLMDGFNQGNYGVAHKYHTPESLGDMLTRGEAKKTRVINSFSTINAFLEKARIEYETLRPGPSPTKKGTLGATDMEQLAALASANYSSDAEREKAVRKVLKGIIKGGNKQDIDAFIKAAGELNKEGNKDIKFVIYGHASLDFYPANDELSLRRAQMAEYVLIALGVDPKRIVEIDGVGEKDPINPGDENNASFRKSAANKENQRIELIPIDPSSGMEVDRVEYRKKKGKTVTTETPVMPVDWEKAVVGLSVENLQPNNPVAKPVDVEKTASGGLDDTFRHYRKEKDEGWTQITDPAPVPASTEEVPPNAFLTRDIPMWTLEEKKEDLVPSEVAPFNRDRVGQNPRGPLDEPPASFVAPTSAEEYREALASAKGDGEGPLGQVAPLAKKYKKPEAATDAATDLETVKTSMIALEWAWVTIDQLRQAARVANENVLNRTERNSYLKECERLIRKIADAHKELEQLEPIIKTRATVEGRTMTLPTTTMTGQSAAPAPPPAEPPTDGEEEAPIDMDIYE